MPQVILRSIRINDAELCYRWLSNPEVKRFLGLTHPDRTLEQERSWIAATIADKEHQRAYIIENENGLAIGTCGLRGVDRENDSALLGIMIGEPHLWNRGYGTEATRALLEIAFNELGLNEVRLSCHPDNVGAKHCYEKVGFRINTSLSYAEIFRDELQMVIYRDDWNKLKENELSAPSMEAHAGKRQFSKQKRKYE